MQSEKVVKTGDSVDKIYNILKKKIIINEIKAGQYLQEKELMKDFSIGRTPLRQALLLLRSDNFIEWQPHRSPFVKEMSLEEVKEIFETLVILEKNINHLAALRADSKDIKKIRYHCEQVEDAIGKNTFWEITDQNRLFHDSIACASRNRFLRKSHDNIRMQAERLSYMAVSRKTENISPEEHNRKIMEHHRFLIEYIESKNIKKLEEISIKHIRLFQERILNDILDHSFL